MKIEELISILNNSGADNWRVNITTKHGWEFYYIKHQLDQNRVTDVERIAITLFKNYDDNKYTGTAVAVMGPDESDEYIKKTIADLVKQTEYVKDKYFDFKAPKEVTESSVADFKGVEDISKDFIKVMDSLNETDTEDINSYEIFASNVQRRTITAKGVDVVQKFPSSMLEVIVNARTKDKDHEIELYRAFNSGTCDGKNIKETIEKAMKFGKDKLIAAKTPALDKIPCLFTTNDAGAIYKYFVDNLSTSNIYRKTSKWKKDQIIADDIKGDKLSVKALRFLENSSNNFAYDIEGTPIKDKVLMQEGVPVAYWGPTSFSYYLGEKDTFIISNYEVFGGSKDESELRSGKYLEVVEFSDFQVNSTTGDLMGEIRLAYLHENVDGEDKVTAVSGGSVSGNMTQFLKNMSMSKEQIVYDNIKIPKITRLEDVTVSGAVD
mgnify:FL=1